jgi:hypothetical protein
MKRNWFETRDKDNSPHSSGKGHIRWHKKKVCICKPVFNGGSLILVDNQQFQVFEKKKSESKNHQFQIWKKFRMKRIVDIIDNMFKNFILMNAT